jgi:hypothetical protein
VAAVGKQASASVAGDKYLVWPDSDAIAINAIPPLMA